jgi:hypothetical protein
MTAAARCATLLALLASIVACGGGSVESPSTAHAEIASRSSTLSVGDTMTLNPGILYNDGRWVPLDKAKLAVEDTSYAEVDTVTRILRGKKPGIAIVVLDITQVGTVKKNYNIIP